MAASWSNQKPDALLLAWNQDDSHALDAVPLVYQKLRRVGSVRLEPDPLEVS